jgi:DNA-binding GntR family transcriptional regulator
METDFRTFLTTLTDLELAAMIHFLRRDPADRDELAAALEEMRKRAANGGKR